MRVYADTSWWLGYKCRRDTQHEAALGLFERAPEAEVLWTPWQRVEVFNGFCQAERAGLLRRVGSWLRYTQTGNAQNYATVMAVGICWTTSFAKEGPPM